ncbi:MAG TPA: DUF1269 domain-containing protein [Candidatus Binatia bacterium]|nr:DUF1269 domain-containing protein [Candidatus Binatia bacterium]
MGAETVDRMLVVVFDDQAKAHKGKNLLLQLDSDGSISIYRYVVVTKQADGTTTVEQDDDPGRFRTLSGTSLGSFVGRLGEPIATAAGDPAGATANFNSTGIGEGFLKDVTKVLLPNRAAFVAEVAEEWTTPVDTGMERIGGIVFRWTLSDAKHMLDDQETSPSKKPSSPDERMAR